MTEPDAPIPTATAVKLRDAFRDLVRAPAAATLPITLAILATLAPLVWKTVAVSHVIAGAPDGRAAFRAYETWLAFAIVLGAFGARTAAATAGSTMVARRDRALGLGEASARVLVHGIPAAFVALWTLFLVGVGLAGALVTAIPLAAITFVAAPAAAVEGLGPSAAIRRSAALTRGVRGRLAAWTAITLAIEIAPIVVARWTTLRAPLATGKPPVPPVVHAFQVHAAILIAVVLASALAQVVVYRRLRDAHAAR